MLAACGHTLCTTCRSHSLLGLTALRSLSLERKSHSMGWQKVVARLKEITSTEDLPDFSSGTRLPWWVLPDIDDETRAKLRPDALRIAILPRGADGPRVDRSQHVIDIMEFGYCSDTRMAGRIEEKEKQHEMLKRLLLEAGWKDARLWILPLGTLGAIHWSLLASGRLQPRRS